jgi:hypothetical protein
MLKKHRATQATPTHLGAEGTALWERLRADYTIEDAAGLALLRSVCECRERITEMRARIAKDGPLQPDRWGVLKAHPGLAIERDSRVAMTAALRALRLAPGDAE